MPPSNELLFNLPELTWRQHHSHQSESRGTCWTRCRRCPRWCIFYSWDCEARESHVSNANNLMGHTQLVLVSCHLSSSSPRPYAFVVLKMLSIILSANRKRQKVRQWESQPYTCACWPHPTTREVVSYQVQNLSHVQCGCIKGYLTPLKDLWILKDSQINGCHYIFTTKEGLSTKYVGITSALVADQNVI